MPENTVRATGMVTYKVIKMLKGRYEVKEYPLIFSGDMVKATLDGIKTQTRRVIKLKNYHRNVWDYCVPHNGDKAELLGEPYLKVPYDAITDNAGTRITCPYGQVGSRLWVRETWRVGAWDENEGFIAVDYRAGDYARREWLDPKDADVFEKLWIQSTDDALAAGLVSDKDTGAFQWKDGKSPCRWRPSIHMFRWASRITLEITEVRVERLNQMAESDAHLEGVDNLVTFMLLWDRLNKERGYEWKSNCWVWVITFKLCQ